MTYEGTIESAPQSNAARLNRSDSREQDRLNYSHDAFRETALADLDASEALYQDAAKLLMAARINAGLDPLLSGNDTVSTMRRTVNEQNALQGGPNDSANRRTNDATVATRASTDTPAQKSEGGASAVVSEYLAGAGDALTVTRVATGVAIGAAVGLAAIGIAAVSATAAAVAGVAALGYGAYSLATAIPGWIRDAKIVANPNDYTAEQVRQAQSGIRSIGAGTVDLAAGAAGAPIGSIAANALRPKASSASAIISQAFSTGRSGEIARSAFNTVSTRAGDLKTSVSTTLSDATAAASRRAAEIYNSSSTLQYMGAPIKYIGIPIMNGVSGIPASVGKIAEGIKSIATPSEGTRTAVLSFADRGMQKAERGVTSFNNTLESAGNAYISAAHFGGNRAMAIGNAAITMAKPHVESAVAAGRSYADSAIATAKPYAVSAVESTRNFGSRAVNGTVETTRNLYNAERTQNAITSTRNAYDWTRASATVIGDTLRGNAVVLGEKIGAQRAILGEHIAAEQFALETQRVAQNYWRLPSVGKVFAPNGDELGPIVRNANGNHFYIENLLRGRGMVHPLGVERFASGNARFTDVPNGLAATSPLEVVAAQKIPLNEVSISPATKWMAAYNYRMRSQGLA